MTIVIALLRGVNLGPYNRMKMERLRAVCESLKLRDVATYVQSGNVVFRTAAKDLNKLARSMEAAIVREFGFRAPVALRTAAEMRAVAARNPVAEFEPAKLLVTFLLDEPGERFDYFPDGLANAKMPKVNGTGRNWNTVAKLIEMADTMEGSETASGLDAS